MTLCYDFELYLFNHLARCAVHPILSLPNISVNRFAASMCVLIPLLLSACGSGGGDRTGLGTPNTSIGGSISGLVNPVVLQNNSGDNLNLFSLLAVLLELLHFDVPRKKFE